MPIKLNSVEKTVETQISRLNSSINLYAVLYQIITNQDYNKTRKKRGTQTKGTSLRVLKRNSPLRDKTCSMILVITGLITNEQTEGH